MTAHPHIYLTESESHEMQSLIATAGGSLILMANVAVALFASTQTRDILFGILLAAAVALAASLTRLVRLAASIAELWMRKRLRDLAIEINVDPDRAEKESRGE